MNTGLTLPSAAAVHRFNFHYSRQLGSPPVSLTADWSGAGVSCSPSLPHLFLPCCPLLRLPISPTLRVGLCMSPGVQYHPVIEYLRSWVLLTDQQGIEPPPAVCQRHKCDAIPTEPWGRLLCSHWGRVSISRLQQIPSEGLRCKNSVLPQFCASLMSLVAESCRSRAESVHLLKPHLQWVLVSPAVKIEIGNGLAMALSKAKAVARGNPIFGSVEPCELLETRSS